MSARPTRDTELNSRISLTSMAIKVAQLLFLLFESFVLIEAVEQKLDTCRDHWDEFLQATITYNFRRIDRWIDDAREALRKSRIFDLLPEFENSGQKKDHQGESSCVLDCRTEDPLDHSDFRELIGILSTAKTPDLRFRAVVLAERLSSCAELQNVMSQFPVGGRMENLKRALGFLARPITILRLLIETARLLPNFRNIKFHCLEPTKPIRIAKRFRVTAKEAWLALGLPDHGPWLRKILEGGINSFKSLCSRPLSVHAEIQLLLHYQENPGLSPTSDCIGCSKKACLLCEAFLQASPQKFRFRGRHGGCYPAWGLSEAHLKPLYSTLGYLSRLLKQRIIELLKTGSSTPGQAVPQSTIVSDFNNLDLKGIKDLENARRTSQNDREALREKLTRL
jgi:OTT_1508-like deaminase